MVYWSKVDTEGLLKLLKEHKVDFIVIGARIRQYVGLFPFFKRPPKNETGGRKTQGPRRPQIFKEIKEIILDSAAHCRRIKQNFH